MFTYLIESGSHAADLKRKGTFFAGALAFYSLLLAGAGVGSIYAFNANLESEDDYEVLAILRLSPTDSPRETPREPRSTTPPRGAGRGPNQSVPLVRPEVVVDRPIPGRIGSETTRVVDPRSIVFIGPDDGRPAGSGPMVGPNIPGEGGPSNTTGTDGPRLEVTTPPPPPVSPTPASSRPTSQGPVRVPTHVINSQAVSKPVPPYPPLAKRLGVQGRVAVQVVVDEEGRVVAAKATDGHPLLLPAAVNAARQARFTPTILNGQRVKISGVITYNFTLQ